MTKQFTFIDFVNRFNTEDKCLEEIKKKQFPRGIICKLCKKRRKFYKVKGRKSYGCRVCRWQIYPLKGTPFERSRTNLQKWFYAIFLFSKTKGGIPAAQLQRQIGVTRKCAWRMGHKIRELMSERPEGLLDGIVEIDEAYFHGQDDKNFRRSRQDRPDEAVMGIVQRKGPVYMFHLKDGWGKHALIEPIQRYVSKRAYVMTDQLAGYKQLTKLGYKHNTVVHRKEFARGPIHTQNIENTWSHFKRGIYGNYRSVSKKYLQNYADEFAFRYSHRKSENMFEDLFKRISSS